VDVNPTVRPPTKSSELLATLSRLRQTIRRRLVAYGVCAVAAGGVVSFLTVVTLDWLLWLPGVLRLAGGLVFVAGFVAAALHWIVRPLRATIGLDEIAARLEHHFGTLEDRLSSAINFLERPGAASGPLVERVIADTERTVRHYSFESALSTGPLYRQIAWFAVTTLVFVAVLVGGHDWARVGFYRYVYPMGGIEWPRTVSIVPMTRDQAVAIGESVTVRMEVSRGLTESLRGEVHLREPDGRGWTLAMQRDDDGSFYATIDAVTEDLRYWFVAGDDSTGRTPFTIRVVRRPEVVEALATVEPPDYARDRAPRVLDLGDGEVEAPLGGTVRVDISASKPMAATGAVGLLMASGEIVPLQIDAGDSTKLGCRLPVTEDQNFRVLLRDQDGLENHGALQFRIRAVGDTPPVVAVLSPQSLVEVTPTGMVRLSVRAADDFGIMRIELDAERSGTSAPLARPLLSLANITHSDSGVQITADYDWLMEPLQVAPGDVVVYSVDAWDNYVADDPAGQMGQSAPQRLRIISKSEFEVRLRSDLGQLEARIRQAALEQAELLDRTQSLINADGAPIGQRRALVADSASSQANLVRRVRDVARRVSELVDRIDLNSGGDEETRTRVAELAETLETTAAGTMSKAASALTEAVERQDIPNQDADLRKAAEAQEESIEALHALLRTMAQWGQFQGLVAKTRGLLERQDAMRADTSELGRDMLGKTTESLSDEEAARLKRVERRQQQLADDLQQMLASMKRLQEQEVQKDPAGADAVAQAIRAARAHDLQGRMESATDAIRENRTAAATIDQRGASEGLRKVLHALQAREERELAELRKMLLELANYLADIIENEQELRAATREAGLLEVDEEALAALEHEQRRLRRNTLALADDVGAMREYANLGRFIRSGGRAMQDAEVLLQEQNAAAATEKQDEAIAALREAIAQLEQSADEVAQDLMRRSLAQIREQLETVRDAQVEVNVGIEALEGALRDQGRLGRAQAREATRLTRSQGDVRDLVDTVMPDLDKVVVFRFAMERVAASMDEVRTRLRQRNIDASLVTLSKRIVEQVDILVQAAIETAGLPVQDEFVESSGGEGGGGAGGHGAADQKPVPTITELLVLRAMQENVNRRTVELDRSNDLTEPSEETLTELKVIGQEQSEIRQLTELLTEKARDHE